MYCNKCGMSFPDGSLFCPGCGSPIQTAAAAGVPTTAKKKSLVGLYILVAAVVVAVTIAVLLITGVIGKKNNHTDHGSDTNTSQMQPSSDLVTTTVSTTTAAPTTTTPTTRPSSIKLNGKYDLGYFDGEYYINEWADLKLKIPTYWEDEGSGTIEGVNTAIALYRLDEESRGLVQVMLLDRMGERLTPRQMMDLMIADLSSDDEVDFDFDTPSDNVKLANHTGTGVIGQLSAEGETYCCGMYVYEVDDCLIFVHVIGYDRDAMADMMLDFTGV